VIEETREFDAARYLDNEEIITQYLNAALEDGNPDLLRMALDNVAKSTGLGRMLETDWH
jgi:probable addiction module antidote protein